MLIFLKQMDPKHAENSLEHIFPLIRRIVRDRESSRIRSTALWVISWMVEKQPALLALPQTTQDLQQFLNGLMACLNDDEGRVSPSSCTALTSIIKASYTLARQKVSTLLHFMLGIKHINLEVDGRKSTATYLHTVTLL